MREGRNRRVMEGRHDKGVSTFTMQRAAGTRGGWRARLFAISLAMPAVAIADDWTLMLQGYREIEWIAGLSGQSADNGNEWNNADGLPAVEAELSEPHSAMADLAGNIYVADKNAHAIRMIRPDGILITVAGTNSPGFDGDGPATERRLDGPQHAYPLPDGTFYILDTGNRRIRRVDTSGAMTTVLVETAELSRGLWVSRDERVIYYATTKALKKWTPELGTGPGIPLATGLDDAGNLDVAANGDIYISDRGASRVYRVTPSAELAPLVPVAGVGGNTGDGPKASGRPALSVGMREARGVAFHPAGGFFVATHRGGDLWYVDTQGVAWMFVEGDANSTFFPDPQPVPTTRQVMAEPRSVSVALNGDILICGNDAGYVRRIRYIGAGLEPKAQLWIVANTHQAPVVHWRSDPGRWILLESRDPAASGDWVTELIAACTGEPQEWSPAAAPDAGERLYRLLEFRAWPN